MALRAAKALERPLPRGRGSARVSAPSVAHALVRAASRLDAWAGETARRNRLPHLATPSVAQAEPRPQGSGFSTLPSLTRVGRRQKSIACPTHDCQLEFLAFWLRLCRFVGRG